MKHTLDRMILASVIAATPLTAAQVLAQSSTTTPEGLEEVVVTSQKRQQSLQKTPVAVSVFSESFLEDNRVNDPGELMQRIPGFVGGGGNIKTQPSLALRGAGSAEDAPGADQAVGMFVDDIYIAAPVSFDFDLFDLERVEVLRGPQGTIFGKNVVGGALNFITRDPDEHTMVKGELTYGRYGRLDVRGSASGALVDDRLFGLVSLSSRNSDGYVRNIQTGNKLKQDDQASVRAKLVWRATDNLEANLSMDFSRDKSFGIDSHYYGPDPGSGPVTRNEDQSAQNVDGGYDREMWGVHARLTYDMGSAQLVSLTAYRQGDHQTQFDFDALPFSFIHFDNIDAQTDQLSQELRLLGSVGKLEYITGLFFMNSNYSRIETFLLQGAPGSVIDLATGGATFPEILGQEMETDSYAVYAQGTYSFTDSVRLTLGGRYSYDEKRGNTLCLLPGLQCGEVYDVPVSDSWGAFTPKLTLELDVTDDMLTYATVSKGFKSGGFAAGFELPQSAETPFDPEYVWNYELGLKSRFFDNRVQLNLAGFYAKYTDLQVRVFGGGTNDQDPTRTIVGNAGSSNTKGLELELLARPVPALGLWANYTYQDGKYDQLVLEGEDFSGNRTSFTPEHSVSLGGTYTIDLPNEASIDVSADYTHKSLSYNTPANVRGQSTQLDAMVNAQIVLALPGDRWELQLWGKNLTDERIKPTGRFGVFLLPQDQFLAGEQAVIGALSPPLTYGITARYNFE